MAKFIFTFFISCMLNINDKSSYINFCGIKKLPDISRPVTEKSSEVLNALKSIKSNLKKLDENKISREIKKSIDSLKKTTNLDCILKDGISFNDGNKTVKFTTPDDYTLVVAQQSKNETKQKSLEIKFNRLTAAEGFNSAATDINQFLNDIFDKFDFALLQLRKFFLNKDFTALVEKFQPRAVLSDTNIKTTEEIKNLFRDIQTQISSIKNPATHTKIKNGYPTVKTGIRGSKQIDFESIGAFREDYSVNLITGRNGQEHLIIKIQEKNKEPHYFFIRPNGEVLKETNFSRVLKIGDKTTYYSQKELDSHVLSLQLETLEKELIKYKQYLQDKIENYKEIKKHLTTEDTGILDKNTLALLSKVKSLYETCKVRIKKIKEADRKNAFKQKFKIDTVMASPTLILRDITPAKESILISFPVMQGTTCTKIIVLGQNDKIKKSLFIRDDKMLKFKATSLGRSKRKDTATNYHSQQEINDSGLNDYLLLIKERLESVPPARTKKSAF